MCYVRQCVSPLGHLCLCDSVCIPLAAGPWTCHERLICWLVLAQLSQGVVILQVTAAQACMDVGVDTPEGAVMECSSTRGLLAELFLDFFRWEGAPVPTCWCPRVCW